MYREYLEFSGFTVETACDGHEAIAKAHEHNPGPGSDGSLAAGTRRLGGDQTAAR
jgi:CheY-like chemotaxis protein